MDFKNSRLTEKNRIRERKRVFKRDRNTERKTACGR